MLLFQISIKDIDGTGKDGRVLKEDILRYIDALKGGQPCKCQM